MWDKFLQYFNDNKDALSLLFGSGIFLAVLGGLYRFTIWLLKEYRLRKIRTNDNFPFKIIPPNSNVAKEILGGADDDPLADRNITYQQRIQGRSTRRELEELIEDHRWLLITGRTGLGKTRETVQLAQSLNNEGWTILHLTRESWLDAPAKLPADIPERKLVFILDDLNKKCYSSKAEIRPNANENFTLPISEPFQTRLQRALEAFEIFIGKSEIKVIATARNEQTSEFDEPSEWDKLEWSKYKDLWENFKLFDLPEPEEKAEQQLLIDTAEKANIVVNPNEIPVLARRNDGTFRNLVENLSSAKTENSTLTTESFRDTLKGTWQKRYQKAIQNYSKTKFVYDAIELLREVGIQLNFSNVVHVAKTISGENFFQRIKLQNGYSSVLKQLAKTENILHPRDGQIEAKGYQVHHKEYLPGLYNIIFWEHRRHDSRLKKFKALIDTSLFPKWIIPKILRGEKINWLEKLLILIGDVNVINLFANSYSNLGFQTEALELYKACIGLYKHSPYRWISKKYRTEWYIWGNYGDESLNKSPYAVGPKRHKLEA